MVPGGPASGGAPQNNKLTNANLDRLHRDSSIVSLHGGKGTSVGLQLADGNLRGSVASAMGISHSHTDGGRGSRAGGRDEEEAGEDDDHSDSATDYTTDGSEIDEEEHHLDEVVDVSNF